MESKVNEDIAAPGPCLLSLRQIASWSLPALRSPHLQYPIAGIPTLQRGLVWNAARTELLWDSLLRGFPIGTFVFCRRLTQQRTRDEFARDLSDATHHLLDGQQRAHAIALGFEDPYAEVQQQSRPILWLDLAPENLQGTRTFLFRLTTEAHPWGYAANDDAGRVEIRQVRESLDLCGMMTDENEPKRRPRPTECWPIQAKAPIPVAWLTACEEHDAGRFWAKVKARCEEFVALDPRLHWATDVTRYLDSASRDGAERLSAIQSGIRRAFSTRIVCLDVPEDALKLGSAQETNDANQQNIRENISNVEHLFHRLNAGGVRLEGDKLAYSMIKAYWPKVEESIRKIAHRRMPEARLVTLAVRAALADARSSVEKTSRERIPAPITVSEIRRLAHDQTQMAHQRKVLDFLISDDRSNLAAVVDTIEGWLGREESIQDEIGLPPVLKIASRGVRQKSICC